MSGGAILQSTQFTVIYSSLSKYEYFRNEPEKASNWPPSHYEFSSLENVVMSPHKGGGLHTPEVEEQRYEDLEEIIKEIKEAGWENIKNHPNMFDASLGY